MENSKDTRVKLCVFMPQLRRFFSACLQNTSLQATLQHELTTCYARTPVALGHHENQLDTLQVMYSTNSNVL